LFKLIHLVLLFSIRGHWE